VPIIGAAAVVLALRLRCCGLRVQADDKTAGWSPNRIYAEAKDELNSGAYDKAIPLYEKLEGRAAGTPLAQQAQLDKAYAQYKDGEKAEAIATLDRFMKLHPASPALDYALYLKGVINFNDDLGCSPSCRGRTCPSATRRRPRKPSSPSTRAGDALPDSRYTPDARARMTLHRQCAGAVRSARGALLLHARRLRGGHQPRAAALADYRDVPALEEALFIMVQSYDRWA
jgi:outer membrane protein assembly factor BamD